jgi:alpha-mannosidase
VTGAGPVHPLVEVDHDAVVVEAVKLAEDRSGDVVVRLYEAHGGRATTRLRAAFPYRVVEETDLLERPVAGGALVDDDDGSLTLTLRAFQIVTLRFGRGTA